MDGIIDSLILLFAVLIGFYIGRFSDTNRQIVEKVQKMNKESDTILDKAFGVEPPNEFDADQKQLEKEREELKEQEFSL